MFDLSDLLSRRFAVAVLVAVLAVASAAYALNYIAVYKPLTIRLEFRELPVTVLAFSFSDYDNASDRYRSVTVALRNSGVEVLGNLRVSVSLYSGSTLLASGVSPPFYLNPLQTATVPVALSWSSGNMTMCGSGLLVVYQSA